MIAKVSTRKRRHARQGLDRDTVTSVLAMPLQNPSRTLICFLIVFIFGALFHFMAPAKYSARVDVVVVAVTGGSQGSADKDVSIDSAVQILYSDAVVGETARALDYPGRSSGLLDELTISPMINSRILRLYVANTDAHLAFEAVTLLSQNFLAERSSRLEVLAEARRVELESQLELLRAQTEEPNRTQTSATERREVLAQLSEEITQLEFGLAAIETIPPEPGFISREAILPAKASRPPATVYLASALGISITLAFIAAPNRRSPLAIARNSTSPKSRTQLLGGINV